MVFICRNNVTGNDTGNDATYFHFYGKIYIITYELTR